MVGVGAKNFSPLPYHFRRFWRRFDNPQNPMNVIGHDDECIQCNMRKMGGNVQPASFSNAADRIQLHFAIHDVTKQRHTFIGDDGDEIRTGLGVIVPLQADGSAMMAVGVIWHESILRCGRFSGTNGCGDDPTDADFAGHQLMQQGLEQLLQRRPARLLSGDLGIHSLQDAGDLALLGEWGKGDNFS